MMSFVISKALWMILSTLLAETRTADKCRGMCGHGTSCRPERRRGRCFNCRCDLGFAQRKRVNGSIPPVYYCFQKCDDNGANCPENSECQLTNLGDWSGSRKSAKLCICSRDTSPSPTGQCMAAQTPPSTTDPAVAIGVAVLLVLIGCVLALVTVVVVLRRRTGSKADTKRIDAESQTGRIYTSVAENGGRSIAHNSDVNMEQQQQQCGVIDSTVQPDLLERSAHVQPVRNVVRETNYTAYEEIDLPPEDVMMYDRRHNYSLAGRIESIDGCDTHEYNELYSCQNREAIDWKQTGQESAGGKGSQTCERVYHILSKSE